MKMMGSAKSRLLSRVEERWLDGGRSGYRGRAGQGRAGQTTRSDADRGFGADLCSVLAVELELRQESRFHLEGSNARMRLPPVDRSDSATLERGWL